MVQSDIGSRDTVEFLSRLLFALVFAFYSTEVCGLDMLYVEGLILSILLII